MTNQMMSLSGAWTILQDPEGIGKQNGWQNAIPKEGRRTITVPGAIPSYSWAMHFSYSNVFPSYHGAVWYYRELTELPDLAEGEIDLLEFDRAGYLCQVWINGKYLGEHRHHEERFSFNVTPYLKRDGNDLLAVRCFEPLAVGKTIDGIRLAEIPNGVWACSADVLPGVEETFCMECFGGITGEVRLMAVPTVRIEDCFLRPMAESGRIEVTVTVVNEGDDTACESLCLTVTEQKRGVTVLTKTQEAQIPAGRSEICLAACVEHPTLWELDNPFLYIATLSLSGGSRYTHRFGFKDFRIKNGFFFLNGRRILLKGSHAITSISNVVSMKALGFNAIRSIHRSFIKEVMDVCDEIGMLVIESPVTAWGMTMHENTRQMVYDYTANMVRLHRNHVSMGAFYLFNELHDREIMNCGAEALPDLRRLAPDHLFFLSSGRWDADETLGSASNPGSDAWDTYLGAEGIASYTNRELPRKFQGGHTDGAMGDIHPYMNVPVDAETRRWFRTMGEGVAPVFVSETGIGSQADPMRSYLMHCHENLMDVITVKSVKRVWTKVDEFLDFYGLRKLYPLATDICKEADRLNGAQRTLVFNMIRANPMINGFSLTSVGTGNEGVFEEKYVVKESVAHALQEGWESLRWALFSEDRVVYANRPFTVEAVLCNEDVLPAGSYRAMAYIRGEEGCVFEKSFNAVYPGEGYGGMQPLAASVLKEPISLPEGEYVFSVRLLEENAPFGGDLPIRVVEPRRIGEGKRISTLNLPASVEAFLRKWDYQTADLANDPAEPLILIGETDENELETVLRPLAESGHTLLFTDIHVFERHPALLQAVAGEGATVTKSWGRLYHHDQIAKPHPVFEGLQKAGILDMDAYGEAYPRYIVSGGNQPDQTLCAAVRIEATLCGSGLALGEYCFGNGRAVVNAFRLEEALGRSPYADRLMLNLLAYYA